MSYLILWSHGTTPQKGSLFIDFCMVSCRWVVFVPGRLKARQPQLQPNTFDNYVRMSGQFILRALKEVGQEGRMFNKGQLRELCQKEEKRLIEFYHNPNTMSNVKVPCKSILYLCHLAA